ncbi:MAG: hypothetical protein PF481_03390 [Bacteroidales bacterium]|jgi:hypothetical protein|nr:hypothetical protein [Bacteroidales bacterium]
MKSIQRVTQTIILSTLIVTAFFSCNTKPELSKDYLQGEWECYDYVLQDTNLNSHEIKQIRSTVLSTSYIFEDTVLHIQNQYVHVACACEYDFEQKKIAYSQINNSYIQPSEFIISDYTENTMILNQIVSDTKSRIFLQRKTSQKE